jgi:antitoxin component YwqK of YwqJK toxin-antitoxin module
MTKQRILTINLNFIPRLALLLAVFCLTLLLGSCHKTIKKEISENQVLDYSIDTTAIPNDTIDFQDPRVSYVNGIYFFKDKKFSGILRKVLRGYNVKTYSSLLNGQLHGTYRSFYENGQRYEVRRYKNNLSLGKQYGYWEGSGQMKFEYNYYNEKKEGLQKNWYYNGDPNYVYNYKNDRQDGLQQAWRSNGSLYRNFIVKEGVRYGLQNSFSCYEVRKGKIKRKNP